MNMTPEEMFPKTFAGIRRGLAQAVDEVPQLKRGQVWCVKCGATRKVDSGECLSGGWPKCCRQTMTIDSPEERAAMKAKAVSP